jgi:hypothetical protein
MSEMSDAPSAASACDALLDEAPSSAGEKHGIASQLAAFKAIDAEMSESAMKRARSETPPLPMQRFLPASSKPNLFAPTASKSTENPHCRSIYVGVNWDQRWEKWKARIMVGGRMRHLGYFDREADAAKKYDEFACQTAGKPLNFPVAEGQKQAVKKATVVKRTNLSPNDRQRGQEWISKGLMRCYEYAASPRDDDEERGSSNNKKPADSPSSPSTAADDEDRKTSLGVPAHTFGLDDAAHGHMTRRKAQESGKTDELQATHVARHVERIIFQARQGSNAYFEKVHQVSADIQSNEEVRLAALSSELPPSRLVAMDSLQLQEYKRGAPHVAPGPITEPEPVLAAHRDPPSSFAKPAMSPAKRSSKVSSNSRSYYAFDGTHYPRGSSKPSSKSPPPAPRPPMIGDLLPASSNILDHRTLLGTQLTKGLERSRRDEAIAALEAAARTKTTTKTTTMATMASAAVRGGTLEVPGYMRPQGVLQAPSVPHGAYMPPAPAAPPTQLQYQYQAPPPVAQQVPPGQSPMDVLWQLTERQNQLDGMLAHLSK